VRLPLVAAVGLLCAAFLLVMATAPADAPAKSKGKGKGSGGPRVLVSDTGNSPDPIPLWGQIACESDSRHSLISTGGDLAGTAFGVHQGDEAFRRLTVFDGDEYWGERCELGKNSGRGPVAFYREGRRRVTYATIRLPGNYPLASENWQNVLQMKQAGPADNDSGVPVLRLSAYSGMWWFWHSPPGETFKEDVIWTAPAQIGAWTRFAFDVRYSASRRKGFITVLADLTGDQDFADAGERSRTVRTNTLKREVAGTPSDGHRRGNPLPSHLRVGTYHDDEIPCPPPTGCSVDVDNVQVVAP
jgi:Polysaccharide lyase